MTVKELIAELQKLPNPEQEVIVNIKTYTQVYGQARVTPYQVDRSYDGATIQIALPEGYSIHKRNCPFNKPR